MPAAFRKKWHIIVYDHIDQPRYKHNVKGSQCFQLIFFFFIFTHFLKNGGESVIFPPPFLTHLYFAASHASSCSWFAAIASFIPAASRAFTNSSRYARVSSSLPQSPFCKVGVYSEITLLITDASVWKSVSSNM